MRECNAEIGEGAVRAEEQSLSEAVVMILNISHIARKEGLLALEVFADRLTGKGQDRYLKDLIMMVVDGMDPDITEEILLGMLPGRMDRSLFYKSEDEKLCILLKGTGGQAKYTSRISCLGNILREKPGL